MRRERAGHTLQPTALVNEAYLRLVGDRDGVWENRGHFYGAAARSMRQILIEHARSRSASKRGCGRKPVDLTESLAVHQPHHEDLMDLGVALDHLHEADPRAAQVVELRYFAGFSFEETADLLGISEKTAKRDWQFARVWLERNLRGLDRK